MSRVINAVAWAHVHVAFLMAKLPGYEDAYSRQAALRWDRRERRGERKFIRKYGR